MHGWMDAPRQSATTRRRRRGFEEGNRYTKKYFRLKNGSKRGVDAYDFDVCVDG